MADFRHRALRHRAEGILLCEHIFGAAITNSEGKKVPVALHRRTACSRGCRAHTHCTSYRKSSPFGGCTASVLSRMLQAACRVVPNLFCASSGSDSCLEGFHDIQDHVHYRLIADRSIDHCVINGAVRPFNVEILLDKISAFPINGVH